MTVENSPNSGNGTDGGNGTPSVEANPAREQGQSDRNPNGGIATETAGRENAPDLYESDVFGRVEKRRRDNIWTRGNERRISHRKRKKAEEDE